MRHGRYSDSVMDLDLDLDMIRVTSCRKTYISKGLSELTFCFSTISDFELACFSCN